MCGLTGIWSNGSRGDLQTSIRLMSDAVYHRGPDAGGDWVDADAGVALGHRRLAIVELSELGAQPMHSACGRYVLVFNGEIYNHLELRRALGAAGMGFDWRGGSDTETLLAGFVAWGVAATLQRAVGMFAIALWDRRDRRLTLARDRFGEKPLYYGWAGQGSDRPFVFGSELKALRAFPGFDNGIDRGSLGLMLQFCAVPAPHSIFENVCQLSPGTLLTLNAADLAARQVKVTPFWRADDMARQGLADPFSDEGDAIDALDTALHEAIGLQMIADVPVGAFLSGGIDSSTVVAIMQAQSTRPVQTFTVGFDEAGFDEAPFAAAVARHLGTEHNELRVNAADALNVIPRLATMYDEPFADSSQIPTSIICAAARGSVTVALSGDGGDELFGGYNRYVWGQRIWRPVAPLPFGLRRALGAAILAIPTPAWNGLGAAMPKALQASLFGDKAHKMGRRLETVRTLDDLYRSLVTEWPVSEIPVLDAQSRATRLDDLGLVAGIDAPEQRMMLWDSLTYLPDDILTKVDRAAMAVSLETRVPMLDHRVAEVAWRLPMDMKIRNGQGKWALRQVLDRYVPRALIERPKAGFGAPIGQWLRGPLRDWAEALLDETRLRNEGYLEPAAIRALWYQHLSGQGDWTIRLWSVLMFQAWLEGGVSSGAVQMPTKRLV
jgi:asparagine synthase (glutamine-hydrolysing)